MEYKYSKRAGALNEAAPAPARQAIAPPASRSSLSSMTSGVGEADLLEASESEDYAIAHSTGVRGMPVADAPLHAQSRERRTIAAALARSAGPPPGEGSGLDPVNPRGGFGMFFYTVRDGQRVLVIDDEGRVEVVAGPKRIWRGGRRFEAMAHYLAHPGEFLIVRFRDGRQEHLVGPADLWFDPRVHARVDKEDALQIASKEAVVVYSRDPATGAVTRRVVNGPAMFVPAPGEWLHTFSWHGSKGGAAGYQKVPNGLVFQKLWFLPDQMYHDVPDVRTADDAVLTIKLMIFFELLDVEKMLGTTHDPIGDFVNATTSDVVDLVSRHDFASLKRHTDKLNDLATYRQLVARAEQCGYRIDKVVYRGYGAPDSLQRMHDEAIESRTRLLLERATEEQAQDLEDFKLARELTRAGRQRGDEEAQLTHALDQGRRRQEAELRDEAARREFTRAQAVMDGEQAAVAERARHEAERQHLDGLRGLGVDLTALLTQGRADRVIELRGGGAATHLHLDGKPAAPGPRDET